jgi:ribosomal protein L22
MEFNSENVKINKNSNSPEYIKNYMRDYIKKQSSVNCVICGGKYKPYQKYLHDTKAKKHLFIINKLNENRID